MIDYGFESRFFSQLNLKNSLIGKDNRQKQSVTLTRESKMNKPKSTTVELYEVFEVLNYLSEKENIEEWWPNYPENLSPHDKKHWVTYLFWRVIRDWFGETNMIPAECVRSEEEGGWLYGEDADLAKMLDRHFNFEPNTYFFADY